MTNRVFFAVLVLCAVSPLGADSRIQFPANSEGSKGEIDVRGSTVVEITELNRVRYEYRLKRAVTAIDAPALLKLLPFVTKVGAAKERAEDAVKKSQPEAVAVPGLTQEVLDKASAAERLEAGTAAVVVALRAFLAASNGYPPASLKAEASNGLTKAEAILQQTWPQTDELRAKIQLQKPDNKETLLKILDELDKAGKAWRTTRDQIAHVAERLRAATSPHTSLEEEVNCKDGPRKTAISLLIFDLFPPEEMDDEESGAAKPVEKPMVTLVCEHPLSVSTGFFFSTLDEKDYDFRSQYDGLDDEGNPTASDVVGFNNRSNFRIMPGVLINTRLMNFDNTVAMHLSFGGAADIGGEAGTDIEFIIGPSFSVKKNYLFTVGAHIGRVTDLQGGYMLGTPKIDGLDAVPTQKAYRVGLGFGFSYRFTPKAED